MKTLFVFLCAIFLSTLTFASSGFVKKDPFSLKKNQTKREAKKNQNKIKFGRECCTQSATDSDGNIISVTACAGWFLSNSLNAYERACDKALAGLSAIVENP